MDTTIKSKSHKVILKDLRKEKKECKERLKNLKKEIEECKRDALCLTIEPISIKSPDFTVVIKKNKKLKKIEAGPLIMEKFLNEFIKTFVYEPILKASVVQFHFMEDTRLILTMFESMDDKRCTTFWNLQHYNSANICKIMGPHLIRFKQYVIYQWNRKWRPFFLEKTNRDVYPNIMSYLIPL